MLILTAPGQGAQTPGFLSPWLELPGLADQLGAWSELAGRDLIRLGTTGSAEEITDTSVAQPLLVAAALAVASLLPEPDATAGHSVGELAAGAIAGVVSPADAIQLTAVRGNAMRESCNAVPTGMTAILGGDQAAVLAAIDAAGATPANVNGAGQVVAGGHLEHLEAFAANPPKGARLRPLKVAGAFHTEHMAPAVDVLARLARSVSTHDPRTPVISNRDGQVVHDGRDVVRRIVTQISNPVRWDLCMETMLDLGVTGLLEMPPAGTLTGIARRAMKGVETFALKTPDQLDDARAFIEKHGAPSPLDTSPTWRMLVAPSKGTFRQAGDVREGDTLRPESTIGAVQSRGDETPVSAPHGGTVVEWLVEDGDLVSPGQPLVRLHPEGVS